MHVLFGLRVNDCSPACGFSGATSEKMRFIGSGTFMEKVLLDEFVKVLWLSASVLDSI